MQNDKAIRNTQQLKHNKEKQQKNMQEKKNKKQAITLIKYDKTKNTQQNKK